MKKRFDLVKMEKVAALAAPLLSIAGLQAQEKPLNVIYIMSDVIRRSLSELMGVVWLL